MISIVVPTFNQGPYIEATLESIATQTYSNFEVIIQDNNSIDGTRHICETYAAKDPRFKYFREKDSGQSDAINRGLKRTSGVYFTWICSDDLLANPESLARLVAKIEKSSSEVVGVFGRATYIAEDGIPIRAYETLEKDVFCETFKTMWPFSQPASIVKLAPLKNVGGVNPTLHLCMDQDLFIRLTKKENSRFEFVPFEIAKVRVQPESKSFKNANKSAIGSLKINLRYFGVRALNPRSIYLGQTVASMLGTPGHRALRYVYRRFIRERNY